MWELANQLFAAVLKQALDLSCFFIPDALAYLVELLGQAVPPDLLLLVLETFDGKTAAKPFPLGLKNKSDVYHLTRKKLSTSFHRSSSLAFSDQS